MSKSPQVCHKFLEVGKLLKLIAPQKHIPQHTSMYCTTKTHTTGTVPITTKKYGPFTKIVIKWRISFLRERQEKDICKTETPHPAKEGGERVTGDGCGHSALYETVKKNSYKRNCFKPLGKIKA